MLVEVADGHAVVGVLVVSEAEGEGSRGLFGVGYHVPEDPVGEESEGWPARGEVDAGGGEIGVEEVEVRPGVGAHAVAVDGTGESAVVAGAGGAVVEEADEPVVALAELRECLVVGDAVAIGGEAGEPEERLDAVEAGGDAAGVQSDDASALAVFGLDLIDIGEEREDDLAALLGG